MQVERTAEGRIYVTADDGTRYRVHDVRFTGGRYRRYRLADGGATSRLFVPADPDAWIRSYPFRDDEPRQPTDEALARQLRAAAYARRGSSFDSSTHGGGHPGG